MIRAVTANGLRLHLIYSEVGLPAVFATRCLPAKLPQLSWASLEDSGDNFEYDFWAKVKALQFNLEYFGIWNTYIKMIQHEL